MSKQRGERATGAAVNEKESEFQAAVIEWAQMRGWRVFHDYDSRRNASGFPDLCMSRDGRVIFAELKTARGVVRTEQRDWLTSLGSCAGVEVYLWRPSSWGQIERALM